VGSGVVDVALPVLGVAVEAGDAHGFGSGSLFSTPCCRGGALFSLFTSPANGLPANLTARKEISVHTLATCMA